MNIDKYFDVIDACRFCFMCRHLATLGNVTFKEADTPRGRALILDKVRMDKENLNNPDYINTIYEAPLSAACCYHCVSHYDEVGLLLAARRDIVEAGFASEKVKKLATDLKNAAFSVESKGDVLYYVDSYSENADAFIKLAGKCKTLKGGDTGKALKVLGFDRDASEIAAKLKVSVKASGCKTVVTSCPASYDALKKDFLIDNIEVMHSSEYLLKKGLKANNSGRAYYLESDFLKNYNDNMPAPRKLLESLGYELCPFGTNSEESYAVGEGAVIYDKLNPELTEKLCKRVFSLMDKPEEDILITASPFTKFALKKFTPQVNVISLEEAVLKTTRK